MKLDPRLTETLKVGLAFGWHVTDYALDHFDAPRRVRQVVAGVGVAWSAYWLYQFLRRGDGL